MPTPIHTPQSDATIGGMKPVATPLASAGIREQWDRRIKDQSVFSARTTEQSYIDYVKGALEQVAAGTMKPDDAEAKLRETLKNLGYSPQTGFPDANGVVPPATPGSIRDLSSTRRIQLIIDTNVKQARSLGQLAESEDPATLLGFPAWRLTRTGARKKPRGDWVRRWNDAGASVGWQGASKRGMVALKTSPIWAALGRGVGNHKDAIGAPYPPFAFGSGLAWVDVGRTEWTKICAAEGMPDGMDGVRERARQLKYAAPGAKTYTEIAKPREATPPRPLPAPPQREGARIVEPAFVPDFKARLAADNAIDDALADAKKAKADIDSAAAEMGKSIARLVELDDEYGDGDGEIAAARKRIETNVARVRAKAEDANALIGRIVNYGSSVSTHPKPRSQAEQTAFDGEMTRISALAREAAKKADAGAKFALMALAAAKKSADGIANRVKSMPKFVADTSSLNKAKDASERANAAVTDARAAISECMTAAKDSKRKASQIANECPEADTAGILAKFAQLIAQIGATFDGTAAVVDALAEVAKEIDSRKTTAPRNRAEQDEYDASLSECVKKADAARRSVESAIADAKAKSDEAEKIVSEVADAADVWKRAECAKSLAEGEKYLADMKVSVVAADDDRMHAIQKIVKDAKAEAKRLYGRK